MGEVRYASLKSQPGREPCLAEDTEEMSDCGNRMIMKAVSNWAIISLRSIAFRKPWRLILRHGMICMGHEPLLQMLFA